MKTHTFIFCFLQLLVLFAGGQTEVKVSDLPCKSSIVDAGKENYYGYGYGISTDPSIARNKATMLATQELATAIKSHLNAVTSLYTSQQNGEHKQEFESLINESVSETIEGAETICHKQEKVDGGKIKIYVAVLLPRTFIIKNIETKATDKKHDRLDYDKQKFEEIFNKEFEKKNGQ
jgi:hypothetical protein